MSGPVVSSYSGHACERRRGYAGKVGNGQTRSHRCADCGSLRYTMPKEWNRAAKPRCLGCGGRLIETAVSSKRTIGMTPRETKKAVRAFHNQVKESVRYTQVCWSCGQRFELRLGLATHVSFSRTCRYDYGKDGKCAHGCCLGTFDIVSGHGEHRICGVSVVSGITITAFRFDNLSDAQKKLWELDDLASWMS